MNFFYDEHADRMQRMQDQASRLDLPITALHMREVEGVDAFLAYEAVELNFAPSARIPYGERVA
jgi:hypothetical protein